MEYYVTILLRVEKTGFIFFEIYWYCSGMNDGE